MLLAEMFPYAQLVHNVLIALYAFTVVATIVVILGENRNPVKSLAWVTVLITLPLVGLVLYIFFGRSLKSVHIISRKNRLKLRSRAHFAPVDVESLGLSEGNHQQVRLVNSTTEPHFFTGSHVQIFTTGAEKMAAFMEDLRNAQHYINMQYYIFEDDNIGRQIRDILIDRAQHGVKVRLSYDHVGSFTIHAGFFKRMRREGIEAYPFLKVTFPQLANRLNWRNHRKIAIIDGRVGYIGGMNIADRYVTGTHGDQPWRDTHLRITGPAIVGLQYSFTVDWNFMKRVLLDDPVNEEPAPQPNTDGVQILASGPTGKWNGISMVFLKAITMAKERVYIQTPYFLPNDAIVKAMQTAALAGVDVRVMIPRKPDSLILRLASYSYIKQCLLAGIKIYFYEPGMLHSKVVIVDDDFVTTGSTNLDFRSFEHNFECNALIYGEEINRQMTDAFHNDLSHCTRMNLLRWRRRPLIQKAFESMARLLAPIL